MGDSRFNKSVKNARVNLTFYVIIIFISFFSRKIFLDSLGDEFVGVTSTLLNILGVINLAELGIGSAVGYMLYKPLFEKDQKKINEIISVFGYVYRKIGIFIGVIALLLIPFLHLFFNEVTFSPAVLYFAYIGFTLSSLLGYFVNYKQLLLSADQRNYEITRYSQSANVVRLILQTVVAYYTGNFYLWIALEIVFSIIYSIIIERRVKIIYPFLKADVRNGKALFKSYPELMTKTKQLFVHKVGGVVLYNLSPVILFSYTSAVIVAHYSNYTLILQKLSQLISHLLSSMDAAIGSVIAEGRKEMIKRVYWEISSIYYLVAGVLVISLYFLINPFITLFFGAEYVMSSITIIIILINFYLGIVRVANDLFLYGYGLFRDVWAPIAESVVNISVSVVCGNYFGLNGVLFGSMLSVFLFVTLWKPYFLFKNGFKNSLFYYWITISKYLILTVITLVVVYYIVNNITVNPIGSYMNWVLYAVIISGITFLLLYLLMYSTSKGLRDATHRIVTNILKRS